METPVIETPAVQDNTDTTEDKEVSPGLPGSDDDGVKEPATNTGLPGDIAEPEEGNEPDVEESDPLGAPEEYAPFDISAGEDIGYELSDDQKEAFIAFGKDNNLSDKQMAGVINFDIARQKATLEANEAFLKDQQVEHIKEIRKKYGDKYAETHKKNAQVYEKFFSEDIRRVLNSYVSVMPGFFDALTSISSALSEDTFIPSESSGDDPSNRTLEDFFKTKK